MGLDEIQHMIMLNARQIHGWSRAEDAVLSTKIRFNAE